MDCIIRKGERKDIPATFQLIKELAKFEKEPHEVTLTMEQLEADGFGEFPKFRLLVAEHNSAIVGIALYYNKYSTWKGTSYFLEDIIVTNKYRRKGIGSQLFRELINMCEKDNAQRLEWQVLDWNEKAIQFYNKYSPSVLDEWKTLRLDRSQLKKLYHASI